MKKSIVISLLTVTILFCTALCSFAATGIVTTDTLRLRKEASVDASILALLSMNDEVEILEEENGWYKVQSGEYVGYVSKDYISVVEEETPDENEVEVGGEENNTEEETTETEENPETENTTLVKTISTGVKVYITPVINSIVLNTIEAEQQIEVISEINGWSYITSGSLKGWVKTENIVEKEASESEENNTSSQKTGYISGSSVNFREEANTSGTVIAKLKRNAEVTILGEENGWTKIECGGKTGYVSSDYISDEKVSTTTTSRSSVDRTNKSTTTSTASKTTAEEKEESTTKKSSVKGSDIVAYAKKYLGYKYVYGGSSPSGFDCSGFTQYVYKHFGYSISRTSSSQASNGKAVSKSNLQAGDLVCFSRSSSSKKIGHVGIYIGGGKFIHAANSRKGVITSNISGDGYYYVCARRII